MESNVVSLETAKKLQAAGFPQDTAVEWLERPRNRPEYRWDLAMPWQGKFITGGFAAPTAQEIADQLQPGTRVYKQRTGRGWIAKVGYDFEETEARAPTMAEALAHLWLKQVAETDGK